MKTDQRNEITGVVLHKESGRPLRNLLVVAYDLDPDGVNPDRDRIRVNPDPHSPLNDPATFRVLGRDALPNGVPGDRLGSVLTDEEGRFRVVYTDSAFQIRRQQARGDDVRPVSVRSEARPDLFVLVAAPETAEHNEFDNVVFRSNWARINAGRVETYIIEISTETLKQHGIEEPSRQRGAGALDDRVRMVRETTLSERAFADKVSAFHKEIDATDEAEKRQIRDAISRASIRDVSGFSSPGAPVRFVQATERIGDVQAEQYGHGAARINSDIASDTPLPGDGIEIAVYLTDAELAQLDSSTFQHGGHDYVRVQENKIQEFLFKREDDKGIGAILFSENPISEYCLERTTKQACMTELTAEATDAQSGNEDEGDHDGGSGAVAPLLATEDLPALIARVLGGETRDLLDLSGLSSRPDAASVQTSVASFSLDKGPADATAFYDFDTLHVAFGHVWQQLVDEILVDLGEKAHFGLRNSGRRSPFSALAAGGLSTKAGLTRAIAAALAELEPISPAILRSFDINALEYEALTPTQRKELNAIAEELVTLRGGGFRARVTAGAFGGSRVDVRDHRDHSARIEALHEQGELMIENVRVSHPNTTNHILRDLRDRLNAAHEFTVFAADKTYHSVNFGILNTYRQKWEPTTYQAGRLVKTIAMAPGEERKYSVRVDRKLTTAEREAEKHNSGVSGERSLTSRAEAEIVSKAQKKSDFDFSAKASYGQSWAKLGIGKDAKKDSSEAKKQFRESVLKSAQEYKDEWSIAIDTDETYESSDTQSGVIRNPNEELSVTYLFYQLQRRYRVSESLHRTVPVVMVAMDVPAPHEIDEGWVIAHDWILNRALLDDSFRPALEDLAQHNVGSDFALRELRRSLREQRRHVRKLEHEFAKLKRDVENKYDTYRDTVDERIEEEHDKRFYKRRLWDFVFNRSADRPDTPDPEMAKALEQAAADDHAYAVEQSKQIAMTVEREAKELHRLVRRYNAKMTEYLDRLTIMKRLLVHVKENILYYMQAIWSMEPPDQRFMRLHDVRVPSFRVTRSCVVDAVPSADLFARFRRDGKKRYRAWLCGTIEKDASGNFDVDYKPLVEVADLDNVLGFKGNYMMFPLKDHNALTELMAAPYVDEAFGAMDPDQLGSISMEEYARYVCCFHEEDPEAFEAHKSVLREWLSQLLANRVRAGEEIIVPTDSLFIEMLPSDRSLLEDFKLKHRQMDVMKVSAEVRQAELENLRLAARLLSDDYADPRIDKNVLVQGGASVIVGDD